MSLQWFPGHMKKTLDEIQKNLKLIDIFLFILDARIPFSSMNFELLKKLNNKTVLIIFNKISLADNQKNKIFIDFFHQKKLVTLFIDSKEKKNLHQIENQINKIFQFKTKKLKSKFLKLMVVGMPNVGKSTLINCLAQKKVVQTANIPGVTKNLQWINLKNNMKLLDTPGVLYPKFLDPRIGYSLALCGCIKDTILPKKEILNYILPYLNKYYPLYLKKYFNLNKQNLQISDLFKNIIHNQTNNSLIYNEKYENKITEKIFYSIKNEKNFKINYDLELKHFLKNKIIIKKN